MGLEEVPQLARASMLRGGSYLRGVQAGRGGAVALDPQDLGPSLQS